MPRQREDALPGLVLLVVLRSELAFDMAPLHRTTMLLWSIIASILVLTTVNAQEPEHTVSYFHNLPARLFFFDDQPVSPVVWSCNSVILTLLPQSLIYHDVVEQNIYVSNDEGRSWTRADDIPEHKAAMVIEHPFDNNYVCCLTLFVFFH